MKRLPTAILVMVLPATVHAEPTAITLPKVDGSRIVLDGHLDDPAWQDLAPFGDLLVLQPDLLTEPDYATRVRMFYTDRGLYVGIEAEQPPGTLLPRLTPRDGDINRDGTSVYIDTSGQGSYGFFYGVNLGGSLIDGTILAERQLSRLWDGPWRGETKVTEDGYTTEMFLPWSMMQMPNNVGPRQMGIYVGRHVAHLDEEWGWPTLPTTRTRFISGFQPVLLEDINPQKQLAVFPFSSVTWDEARGEDDYRIGADIFWRPSSNFQLTTTLNPDFGTVESDDVVVNLTAFETFFPEKRPFFLEGNEIFVTSPRAEIRGSSGGTGARQVPNTFFLEPTTLVNTRRIGGAPIEPASLGGIDLPDHELSKPSELMGAAKVTGEVGRIRYGVLGAFEDDTTLYGTDPSGNPANALQTGRDFGIARVLYEDASGGRKAIGFISTLVAHDTQDAQTQGIDLHYLNKRGNFYWDAQLMRSDVANTSGYGAYVDFQYIPRRGHFHKLSLDYFDDQLDVSDLGFIRRNDDMTARYTFSHTKSGMDHLRVLNRTLTLSYVTNTDNQHTRTNIWHRNSRTFNNKNQLTLTGMYIIKGWDDRLSRGNGTFRVRESYVGEAVYGTDTSKPLSFAAGVNVMSEKLGGWTYTFKGGITYKPLDNLSVELDASYRLADNWLIHLSGRNLATYDANHFQPKLTMDLFLTARQQLRFSLQWVGIQADAQNLYQTPATDGHLLTAINNIPGNAYDFTISRLTTQLRYRWEIAPMSDLFVVYTRGANLPNRQDETMGTLFTDALSEPVIDRFVVKLRYRFGN